MSCLFYFLLAFPFWHHKPPPVSRVQVETSAGSFLLEVHRDWAPRAADRLYQLVRAHYFDDSRFFRVVPGKWVQFGIAGSPALAQSWRANTIPDDPLLQHNTRGFVAFSNTGPNTRSTQVFINLGDNTAQNDKEPGFAPFARVIRCIDVVDKLYSGYAERSGGGMRAGHQDALFTGGNAWLDQNFPSLDHLIRARIQ